MITFLLYRLGILKKESAIDGFISMYYMAADVGIVAIIGLIIYRNL